MKKTNLLSALKGQKLWAAIISIFLILSLVIVIFIVSANNDNEKTDNKVDESAAITEIGESMITEMDLSYMIDIENAYGNKSITDIAAFVSMINNILELEVARLFDVEITEDELNNMSKHADEFSQAPEILAEVKKVFGSDTDSYERLYLSPRIINRKLRGWYSRNEDIHKDERSLIEKAFSSVWSGEETMESAAEANELIFSSTNYNKSEGEVPSELQEYFTEEETSSNDPLLDILEGVAEGAVYENIVESDTDYKIVKLVKKEGEGEYLIETVAAEKRAFDEWFQEQAAELPFTMFDEALGQEVVSTYPDLWWVKLKLKE